MVSNSDRVYGIKKEIFDGFIELIRKKYKLSEKANFFLEINSDVKISGINSAISNQRDMVSHFCQVLSNADLTDKECESQLNLAKEHVRRSISEPYQTACSFKFQQVLKLIDAYKSKVLPFKNNSSFSSAPNLRSINLELDNAKRFYEKGREAKSNHNLFSPEWEEGMGCFVETVKLLNKFEEKLENYCFKAIQLQHSIDSTKNDKKQKGLSIWSIVATALFGITTILLSYFIYILQKS